MSPENEDVTNPPPAQAGPIPSSALPSAGPARPPQLPRPPALTPPLTPAPDDEAWFPNPQPVSSAHPAHMPPRKKAKPVTTGVAGTLVTILGVGVIAGGVGGVLGYSAAESRPTSPASVETAVVFDATEQNSPETLRVPEAVSSAENIAVVAESVRPSVAHVSVMAPGGMGEGGTGSGFFISEDGLLLTNNHVATAGGAGAEIKVQTFDGETYDASIVGTSPEYDLAVLRVKDVRAKPLPIGNSRDIKVGETVVAIGSPLGLQGTVTSGIVSALDRAVIAGGTEGEASYLSAIQTDAAINPGNSGGPLVNLAGEVIGINTAIATVSGAAQSGSIGLGFAVPMHVVKRVSQELIKTGSAVTPVIGVEVDLQYTGGGARLLAINPGGSAEKAGLRAGDIVKKVNGSSVPDASSLIVSIRALVPGETATLTVSRDGQILEVPVLLGTLPPKS